MTLRFALTGAILAAGVVVAPLAQAATVFTFSGGTDYLLPSDFGPAPSVPGLGAGTTVQHNATLGLSGPGRVTFSYLGTEAGYENRFLTGGMSFDNKSGSNPSFQQVFGAGSLDFAFDTVSPAQQVANGGNLSEYFGSIALFKLSDTSVYALFNDGARLWRRGGGGSPSGPAGGRPLASLRERLRRLSVRGAVRTPPVAQGALA